MRSRAAFFVAIGAAAFGALIAACTDLSGLSGASDPPPDADASAVGESGVDASSVDAPDGATSIVTDGSADSEAEVVTDAGMKIDASGCMTCDCDLDGFNTHATASCANASGPDDCDDTDSRARPSQGYTSEPIGAPLNGDWNCNLTVQRLYSEEVVCTELSGGAGCDNTEGFIGPSPDCGAAGTVVTCKTVGTAPNAVCVEASRAQNIKQACK